MTSNDRWSRLRLLPVFLCFLVAVGMAAGPWIEALGALARASMGTGFALLWISGPFLLAIALAVLVRRGAERIVFDFALVTLALMDAGALLLSVLPFVNAWDLFAWLPFLQFTGLTVLLGLVLLGRRWIPELAKRFRSGTLKGT